MRCERIKLPGPEGAAMLSDREFALQVHSAKETLLQARNHLDTVCVDERSTRAWSAATSWREASKHILRQLTRLDEHKRRHIPRDASNAFCKMLELLTFVAEERKARIFATGSGGATVRHFDNASLPGDFVRAVAWYVRQKGVEHDWRACSLLSSSSSSSSSVLGDRFALYRDHPQRWLMDDTRDAGANAVVRGDLSDPTDVTRLVQRLVSLSQTPSRASFQPNLYTSDLGFEFSYATLEEEQQLQGNLGQVFVGLSVLERGGVLITKQFTALNPITAWLLTQLAALFEELWLVKPLTSKADNAETYVVGIGFLPTPESSRARDAVCAELLRLMTATERLGDGEGVGEGRIIAPSVVEAANRFARAQSDKLTSDLSYYSQRHRWSKCKGDDGDDDGAARAADMWIQRFIKPEQQQQPQPQQRSNGAQKQH